MGNCRNPIDFDSKRQSAAIFDFNTQRCKHIDEIIPIDVGSTRFCIDSSQSSWVFFCHAHK